MIPNHRRLCLVFLIASVPFASLAQEEARIDLSGQWSVQLDPNGTFDAATASEDHTNGLHAVQLPGSLRDSHLGNPVGPDTNWIGNKRTELLQRPEYKEYQRAEQFKMPFWLQPELHYVGLAHYQRNVEIPESWRGRRVVLLLERPHWRTRVAIDGRQIGSNDSLSVPHRYDLTESLTPGQHQLTISVDNSLADLDVGVNSHSVSDHTQSAWHGIVGRIELYAEPMLGIENVQVIAAEDGRSADVLLQLTDAAQDAQIAMQVTQDGKLLGQRKLTLNITDADRIVKASLTFDQQAKLWDEFQPNLCQLEITVSSEPQKVTTRRVSFGVRHIKTAGTQFVLNDRPLFLRGTLECCIFPLTGYPPTDVESWKRVIRVCKSHGLNHIRFHSWCPPEAAFVAADQLGFYYQVECSTWPNQSTSLGNGRPIDEWLYREGQRVLDAYGNHPSFLLLAMGNEPGGPQRGGKYLGPWVEHFKAQTQRQLVTSGSGWPSIAENQYHVTPQPRIQQWGQGLHSRINAQPPATLVDYRGLIGQQAVPVVSHEIGQWCVYPNFDEIGKYTGALKPRNFEIFRELLQEGHMLDQAHDFLMASGRLQTLCYKEEIESALRTPGFGGFQLLDLHDFPGQGTALVGVLDPFWDSKPYVTPEQFSCFCGPTVPLARLAQRMWASDETFAADIEVSHFGPSDLIDVTPGWTISCNGKVLKSGSLDKCDVPTGTLASLGRIELPLASFDVPAKLTLAVSVDADQTQCSNTWDFWIYPSTVNDPAADDVLIVSSLTKQALAYLQQGGKVVLMADPNTVATDVQLGFSSIFWNTAWTGGQAPHTLGILCDPANPALDAFPTDYHSDWQWWDVVSRAKPMELDGLPTELRPIVQIVPDWFRPQRLGLVLEAKVGGGKLLVTSVDLQNDLEQRPAARQLRHSLLRYVASEAFEPQVSVDAASIRRLFREPPLLQRIGARVQADSAHADYPASNAIDGDPKTIWHTDWEPTPAPMPHSIVIDVGKSLSIEGLRCLPRQDMTNGRIREYTIHVSDDGRNWGDAICSGVFPEGPQPQLVVLPEPCSGRYIRLTANSEINGKPFTSVAELDLVLGGE